MVELRGSRTELQSGHLRRVDVIDYHLRYLAKPLAHLIDGEERRDRYEQRQQATAYSNTSTCITRQLVLKGLS